ncbi:hypothetical protein V8F06_004196 [Rhypophila decipiens]
MSYTPNDASQWSTGGDDQASYTAPTTMGYDVSYLPATTGSWTTTGMEMTSSSAFPDPMCSYMGTSDNTGTYDSSYQYASAGSFTDDQNQYMYQYDQEGEAQEASEEEFSSKKKGKKRAPRKYTTEQMAKRREQNRKAQRVYRDRKDQRIKELEEQLAATSQQTEVISSAIEALRAEHAALTGGSSSIAGYPAYGGYPPATGI